MTVISDLIRQIRDLRLERAHLVFLRAFPSTSKVRFNPGNGIGSLQQFHDTQALAVMLEAAVLPHAFRQHFLAGMPERRVAKIVRQSDRLRQIFIQASARAMVRLIEATSIVCVRRVRKWSPCR